ncbi:MAG TPA: acyltransferase [Candidatus Acidoferrales bacterium]|nr:acyltransferase [Candidatus Acidoferrales bacterium]
MAPQTLAPHLASPQMSASRRDWNRLDGVDLLRGLAILFVVLNHVHMRLLIAGIPYAAHISRRLMASLIWNGQFGVQMFFAVSGFLITSTALRRWGKLSSVSLRDFYLLRVARIAPMLLALLAVLTILHHAGVSPFVVSEKVGGIGRAWLAALTLRVNVLQAQRGWLPANWGVLWSLSVEEMFYLFFPIVALIFGRRNFFPAILLCFVALGPFSRTIFARGNEIWSEQSYLGGMDAIALGCLTALLVRRAHLSQNALRVLAAAGTILILFILVGLRLTHVPVIGRSGLDMTIIALGTCMVITAAAQTQWKGPRLLAPLFRLGRCSYEVYLTHMFVVFALFAIFVKYGSPIWSVPLLFVATVVVAAAVGDIVARLFSEPVNRKLRERWGDGRRQMGSVNDSRISPAGTLSTS